jgi:hypothetical protein
MLGFKYSEESIALMSKNSKGENNLFFDKTYSLEVRAILKKHNLGKTFLIEIRAKLSNKVYIYSYNKNVLFKEFNSQKKAADFFNTSTAIILKYKNTNKVFLNKCIICS